MSVTASERYGLTLAPTGLGLVQDLLNTSSAGRPREPDLLDESSSAREWLTSAIELWGSRWAGPAPEVCLTEDDLPRIRELREHLKAAVGRGTDTAPTSSGDRPVTLEGDLRLTLDREGNLTVQPRGDGPQWLAAVVLGEIQLAQQSGTWRRLKLCRNAACSGAFYDRSRNNSGVWHDVRMCGNAANLRASRARRRSQQSITDAPHPEAARPRRSTRG